MYLRRRLCTLEADTHTSTWADTDSWADDTSSWGNAAGWEIRSGIKCKKKNTTLMAIGGLGFSKDGVSPEEQPGVRLQERELRKEASSWFFKDALTVPGFKCQCLYIHMPYRYFHFGGLPVLQCTHSPGVAELQHGYFGKPPVEQFSFRA